MYGLLRRWLWSKKILFKKEWFYLYPRILDSEHISRWYLPSRLHIMTLEWNILGQNMYFFLWKCLKSYIICTSVRIVNYKNWSSYLPIHKYIFVILKALYNDDPECKKSPLITTFFIPLTQKSTTQIYSFLHPSDIEVIIYYLFLYTIIWFYQKTT